MSLGIIIIVLFLIGLCFVALIRHGGAIKRIWPKEKAGVFLFIGTSVLISLLFAYAAFVRPVLDSAKELVPLPPPHTGSVWLFNEINLLRLGWYVTPIGLVLAYLGSLLIFFLLFIKKQFHLIPFILTVGVVAIFYLYKSRVYPDNYWVIRRYVPLVIPGFLSLAGAVIASCVHWKGGIGWISGFSVYAPTRIIGVTLGGCLFLVLFLKPLQTHGSLSARVRTWWGCPTG